MSLFKDTTQLIVEMAKGTASDLTDKDLDVKLTNISFDDILKDMQSIQMGELAFTAEMVTVRGCKRLGYDLVEIDELAKYMMGNQITDFKEAINNIAKSCDRDPAQFAIVVDESAIRDAVHEAECSLKCADETFQKAKIGNVVNTKKVLDILYDKGLNVVKKS
jgi:predicted transcriptional regulator